jgi:hypothetical protein
MHDQDGPDIALVAERLEARRKLARAKPEKPERRAGSENSAKARLVAEAAREASQADIP